VSDFMVERPTRFHTTAFRPIANLLRQRKSSASFGKSVFMKGAAFQTEEVNPKIMPVVSSLLQKDPGLLEKYKPLLGLPPEATLEEVISTLSAQPQTVANLFESYADVPGGSQYAALGQALRASQTGNPRIQNQAENASFGGNIAGAASDTVLGSTRLGQVLQLLPNAPLGVLGGAAVNPYNVGSDPATEAALGRVVSSQQLEAINAQLANPQTPPDVRQQLTQQAEALQTSIRQSLATAPAMDKAPGSTDSMGKRVALKATNAVEDLTTAATSGLATKLGPAVSFLMNRGHAVDEAASRGSANPQTEGTGMAAAEAGALASRLSAARAAFQAAPTAVNASRAAQAGRLLKALPSAAGASAAALPALMLQGGASLFEGFSAANSGQEMDAMSEEWAQQLATQMRTPGGVEDVARNLVGAGFDGMTSFSTAAKRPFRAGLARFTSKTPPDIQERAQQILLRNDYDQAQHTYTQELAQNFPQMSPDQISSMATEAAGRSAFFRSGQMGETLPASVTVDNGGEPLTIDLHTLQPVLEAMPEAQRKAFTQLFTLAPQAALGLIDDNGGAPGATPATADVALSSIVNGQGIAAVVQQTTPQTDARRSAERDQQTAEADTRKQQGVAQVAKDVQTYKNQEEYRTRDTVLDQLQQDSSRNIEHSNRIAALRKPQEDQLAWRQAADKRWGFDKTPEVAAPALAKLPPASAGGVMVAPSTLADVRKSTSAPSIAATTPVAKPLPPPISTDSTDLAQTVPRWR